MNSLIAWILANIALIVVLGLAKDGLKKMTFRKTMIRIGCMLLANVQVFASIYLLTIALAMRYVDGLGSGALLFCTIMTSGTFLMTIYKAVADDWL